MLSELGVLPFLALVCAVLVLPQVLAWVAEWWAR